MENLALQQVHMFQKKKADELMQALVHEPEVLFMGGMPVEGMVGLAVAAGVMVCVGTVQFRRTGV